MKAVAGLAAGLIFGLGLALSGMIDPGRVLGFLDVAGNWNPSLAFVLAGAVAISYLGFLATHRMSRPALAERYEIPSSTKIDLKLIGGAALFGIGWGLTGFCPGPGIASLSLGYTASFIFVPAMFVGMALFKVTHLAGKT